MSLLVLTSTIILSSVQPADGRADLVRVGPQPMGLEVEIDPITNSVSAFAVAHARDGRLALGCDPDEFSGLRVSFTSKNWFKGANILTQSQSMTYRFDAAPAQRSEWRIKDDSAYLKWRREVPWFLEEMRDAKRLMIRFKDIESRETDVVFPLLDSRRVMDLMLSICRSPYRYSLPAKR